MFGIDISHWNDIHGFNSLHNVDFIILKATEGITYIDSTFRSRIRSILSSGVRIGVYHYFNEDSPEEQAIHFFDTLKEMDVEKSVLPFVDFEETHNTSNFIDLDMGARNLLLFMDKYKALSGAYPHLYMSESVAKNKAFSEIASKTNCKLWIAKWLSGNKWDYEQIDDLNFDKIHKFESPFFDVIIRQISSKGVVHSDSTDFYPIDLNISFIDEFEWDNLISKYSDNNGYVDTDSVGGNVSCEILLLSTLKKFVNEQVKEVLNNEYGLCKKNTVGEHED